MSQSGPIPEAPAETWKAVHLALRHGYRGFPGGTTLAKLLMEHRGKRSVGHAPSLSISRILAWADAFRARNGRWPTGSSGPVALAPGETWCAINSALSCGARGLPGGSSLSRLLAREHACEPSEGWSFADDSRNPPPGRRLPRAPRKMAERAFRPHPRAHGRNLAASQRSPEARQIWPTGRDDAGAFAQSRAGSALQPSDLAPVHRPGRPYLGRRAPRADGQVAWLPFRTDSGGSGCDLEVGRIRLAPRPTRPSRRIIVSPVHRPEWANPPSNPFPQFDDSAGLFLMKRCQAPNMIWFLAPFIPS